MITLKDLPGIPAGSELAFTGSVYRVVSPGAGAIHEFSLEVVDSNPEWFGQPAIVDMTAQEDLIAGDIVDNTGRKVVAPKPLRKPGRPAKAK